EGKAAKRKARPQSMPTLEALPQARSVRMARTRPVRRVLLIEPNKACFGLARRNDEGNVVGFQRGVV
ncbi:MAG: hypothetical protein IJ783_00245, partial [Kiritimatiellae bacterium]|nr:hypothetical protein [Kiritimatiellia bacterium]